MGLDDAFQVNDHKNLLQSFSGVDYRPVILLANLKQP